MEALKALLEESEIASIELIIRPTNVYDTFTLWKQRQAIIEALELDKHEFQKATVSLVFNNRLFDSTQRLDN